MPLPVWLAACTGKNYYLMIPFNTVAIGFCTCSLALIFVCTSNWIGLCCQFIWTVIFWMLPPYTFSFFAFFFQCRGSPIISRCSKLIRPFQTITPLCKHVEHFFNPNSVCQFLLSYPFSLGPFGTLINTIVVPKFVYLMPSILQNYYFNSNCIVKKTKLLQNRMLEIQVDSNFEASNLHR